MFSRTAFRKLRACVATLAAVTGIGILAAPQTVHAQAAGMAGSYGNFDVLNNTGGPTCGFEMEVWGVSKSQLTRIFPSNFNATVIRYGFGNATDFPGGTAVRWESQYDAASGQFKTCTPVPPSLTTVPGDSCWTRGMPTTYQTAGCEHFGISSVVNPTRINYYWLVEDAANPGTLKRSGTYVNLPMPSWIVTPPANPALPPVVAAVIELPPPPPPPIPPPIPQFGDAQWVKVYKNEVGRQVDLDELVGDNPVVVAQDPAHLEVSWSLLQPDPDGGGNQRRRGKLANQGNVGNGNRAIVRRYEYYKYAGVYDPLTHEALCADVTCTAPSPGEVGDAIGAQNAAANLDVNDLTVAIVGNGGVSSTDKVISCANKCYGVYNPGAVVSLTAKANSGSTFSAWSGACTGAAATCNVTLDAAKWVSATFVAVVGGGGGGGGGGGVAQFTVSVGRTNVGTVTASPAGTDRALNCGGTCSAKFNQGTAITLTATPPAGKTFVNWSGGCSGTAPTCSLTVNANVSVQAVFSR